MRSGNGDHNGAAFLRHYAIRAANRCLTPINDSVSLKNRRAESGIAYFRIQAGWI